VATIPKGSPEELTVLCPSFGARYRDWSRRAIHTGLDPLGEQHADEPRVSACPECGYEVERDLLRAAYDGVWQTIAVDEDTAASEG